MPHFGQHIPPTGEPQVQGAGLGQLIQPASTPAAPPDPGSAILGLLNALRPDLAGAMGMPSAIDQMMALQQQAGQMQQAGSPLVDILQAQMENPALGFGAGILKGPGPILRAVGGGAQRTTRMKSKAPLKQEVLEFPEGGQGGQAASDQRLAKAIDLQIDMNIIKRGEALGFSRESLEQHIKAFGTDTTSATVRLKEIGLDIRTDASGVAALLDGAGQEIALVVPAKTGQGFALVSKLTRADELAGERAFRGAVIAETKTFAEAIFKFIEIGDF